MSRQIIPTGNRVLVRIEKAEAQTSESGLYLGETEKKTEDEGIIVAKGLKLSREATKDDDGTTLEEELTIDTKVLFNPYSGVPVQHDGNEHLIVDIKDIIAIIRD